MEMPFVELLGERGGRMSGISDLLGVVLVVRKLLSNIG
jgi:hypothetical protein